jgi:hypothetical protein
MKRPVESDYTSHVAYTRALEEYCDWLVQTAPRHHKGSSRNWKGNEMKTTIEMAREVYGAHTEWTGAPLDRLEQLVALVRADEREQGQKWFDAVTAQHKINVLAERSAGVKAEREACAKLIESRKTGANELMDAVRDMEARAIRARSAGEPRTPADTAEIEEMATDAYGIDDAMLKAREA